jgi:hypothetical protein
MVDIVVRGLTEKETLDLRVLKAQLGERNWRTLFLRIVKERYMPMNIRIDNQGRK